MDGLKGGDAGTGGSVVAGGGGATGIDINGGANHLTGVVTATNNVIMNIEGGFNGHSQCVGMKQSKRES